MYADGFDDALIGVVRRFDKTWPLYDYRKCVEVLMEANLSREQAVDYMETHVIGAYVGSGTPCFAVMGEVSGEREGGGGPGER